MESREVPGMLDAVRGYMQLAIGLTEVSVRKAQEVAASLLSGDVESVKATGDSAKDAARQMSAQVQDLADDIVAQASGNREMLVGLIRSEIDRAAGRLGLVREEELAALRRQVQRLEAEVRGEGTSASAKLATAAKETAAKAEPVEETASAEKAEPAKKEPAKKVPGRKIPVKRDATSSSADDGS